jgi:hypothetical protein
MRNGAATALALWTALAATGSALSQEPSASSPASARPQETPKQPCALRQLASVDLTLADGILIPVTIDGHTGNMHLRFGSTYNVIMKDTVKAFGITPKKVPRRAQVRLGGMKIEEYVVLESMHVGDGQFGRTELLVQDETNIYPGVIGSFGLGYETADIELDLARRKLRLFAPGGCPGDVVYWTDRYGSVPFEVRREQAYFHMELEGRMVETALLPGSVDSWTYSDATRRLFRFDEFSAGVEALKYEGQGAPPAYFRAMQIQTPGLDVRNARVRIQPINDDRCRFTERNSKGVAAYGPKCPELFPLFLGQNVLQKLRIFIAVKEKKIYFSEADATGQ